MLDGLLVDLDPDADLRPSQDGPKHVGLEIDLKGLGHHYKPMHQTTTKDRLYRISKPISDQDRLSHIILSHSVGIQFYP
jgi:hypothetical protein